MFYNTSKGDTPWKTNQCPLKISDWKTSLSFFGNGLFLGDMFVFSGVDGVDVFLLMELSHSSKMAHVLLQIERYVMKYCHAISSTLNLCACNIILELCVYLR